MREFINEFLDWSGEVFNDIDYIARMVLEWIWRICIAILTLPIWIIPFVIWLVFVKRKEGADDGRT